jgi:uncharacterized protein YbjT (DUF2867 family)
MMNMVETILVTGASGNVGSEVIKQLSNATRDVDIKAAVHSAENVKKVVKSDRVEAVQIDYNKPKTLSAASKMLINFSYLLLTLPNWLNMRLIWSLKPKRLELDIL